MRNLKQLAAVLLIGFMIIMVFVAFEEAKGMPTESETILLPYGLEEEYFLYVGDNEYQHPYESDAWEIQDNGLQTQNDPYDFIMQEDYIVFYTNRDVQEITILEGIGEIEFINDREFIFRADVELPDYLVLNITY